jgi:hypothetical protein
MVSKKAHNSVHVKSGEDLLELNDFLKKNKKGIFIVVLMMEGCPHCVTLEKDIVTPLLNDPSRKNGMALIQHTELENTPLKSLSSKVRGYPTVIKVENGKAEEVDDPRDYESMKKLVGSTESSADEVDVLSGEESLPLDESAAEAVRKSSNLMSAENIKSLIKNPKKKHNAAVPNINDDVLSSQRESPDIEFESPKAGKGAAIGGSLYASLLAAGKDLAPAIVLSTAAVASRLALRRKTKRSKKMFGGKRGRRSRRRANV